MRERGSKGWNFSLKEIKGGFAIQNGGGALSKISGEEFQKQKQRELSEFWDFWGLSDFKKEFSEGVSIFKMGFLGALKKKEF